MQHRFAVLSLFLLCVLSFGSDLKYYFLRMSPDEDCSFACTSFMAQVFVSRCNFFGSQHIKCLVKIEVQ